MSDISIKKSKLAALDDHLRNKGKSDQETVAGVIGCEPDDTVTVDAYINRLREKFPEVYGAPDAEEEEEEEQEEESEESEEEEQEEEPVKPNKTFPKPVDKTVIQTEEWNPKVLLDDGSPDMTELEIVTRTKKILVVRRKEKTDLVKIIHKGGEVYVDLIKLAAADANAEYDGLGRAGDLFTAATIAKDA